MSDSVHNMLSMLAMDPIYLAISATAPFSDQRPDNTFPDHHSQLVVLDALDLVIPLLKRYLDLSLSGITTEGIDMGSAHLQSGCECADESANIHSELRGANWLQHRLAISPSPLPSGIHFCIISNSFTATFPVGVQPPPSRLFWFEEPLALPAFDCHCGPRKPWLVSPGVWMPWPPTALHLGWECRYIITREAMELGHHVFLRSSR